MGRRKRRNADLRGTEDVLRRRSNLTARFFEIYIFFGINIKTKDIISSLNKDFGHSPTHGAKADNANRKARVLCHGIKSEDPDVAPASRSVWA